jgi:hypothetical protein
MEGFIDSSGEYAAVPFGKKLMIIHNNQQLDVVNTENQAKNYIKQHKKTDSKSSTVLD